MRNEAIFVGGAVGIHFRGDIHDEGFLLADALPAVVDTLGHLNQHRIGMPRKNSLISPPVAESARGS